MRIKNVKIETLGFDIKLPEPQKSQVLALLPKKYSKKLTFDITEVNPQIANAIRRTILDELKVKVLNVDIKDIDIDCPLRDLFTITDYVANRIALIPLDQDTPLNATFLLDVLNSTDEILAVRSADIRPTTGPLRYRKTFKVAELNPSKRLHIKKITVKEGYGYQNARFSLANVAYKCLDFIRVSTVTGQGFIRNVMIRTSDIKDITRKVNLNGKLMVVKDEKYIDRMPHEVKARLTNYDAVISPSSVKKTKLTALKALRSWSSAEVIPESFRMTITTRGSIEPGVLIDNVRLNIQERLRHIVEAIKSRKKSVVVEIMKNRAEITVMNETNTIGHMLVTEIYKIDPKISLVNLQIPHPLTRKFTIRIVHLEALKILENAIQRLIKTFDSLTI